MKKNKVLFGLIIFIFTISLAITVNATGVSAWVDKLDPSTHVKAASGDLKDTLNQILTIIQFAGTGLTIVAVMMAGVSYLFASVDQKADVKKRMMPILIGSVLIVASVNIISIIAKIAVDAFTVN